ncbi:hypothetical protein VDGE_30752 [Verticillium dahliae]|uniref:Uncharacterized protein n=1 Tax=Verticillium dahliae TaxID=27337 RepID=A0A444RKI6_VERDA|nr:hypothetical protein VDGE_30752 [Verticillium dahliae]
MSKVAAAQPHSTLLPSTLVTGINSAIHGCHATVIDLQSLLEDPVTDGDGDVWNAEITARVIKLGGQAHSELDSLKIALDLCTFASSRYLQADLSFRSDGSNLLTVKHSIIEQQRSYTSQNTHKLLRSDSRRLISRFNIGSQQ